MIHFKFFLRYENLYVILSIIISIKVFRKKIRYCNLEILFLEGALKINIYAKDKKHKQICICRVFCDYGSQIWNCDQHQLKIATIKVRAHVELRFTIVTFLQFFFIKNFIGLCYTLFGIIFLFYIQFILLISFHLFNVRL